MSTHPQPPSAKIYQFPRQSEARATAARASRFARDERSRTPPTVEFGSGWYHDAAILADRVRKP